ncbi:MAG: putative type II secretion system protein HxcR [Gammaproteobacteria bacterium]|nr:putative type II secretion system protein HxcR [Gammaproteobacteria bacterium]
MSKHAASSRPHATIQSLDIKTLLEGLVNDGLVKFEDGKRALMLCRVKDLRRIHPVDAIADQNLEDARNPGRTLKQEDLCKWLADKTGLLYERIDPLKIDVTAVTSIISHSYASKRGIMPLRADKNSVTIATSDPFDDEWVDELSQLLRKHIQRVLVNPSDRRRYTDEFYNLSRSLKKATRRGEEDGVKLFQNLEKLVELGRTGKLDAEDRHIVHIVDWLLQYAFEQRASDIHLEPRRDEGYVRFRIDGVLHRVYQVPANVMIAIVGRIKILGGMDIAEKRRPLDGRLKTRAPEGAEVELRLSTVPTALGEKLVIRIFDPEVLGRSYEQLGLSEQELNLWRGFVGQPYGIILVTGPTGSGKTTTLYSTLKQLAAPEVNVSTIEDPIEMVEPSFNQIQVHPAIDLTFATGVRSLLRQDPDIIMIGEIRDLETAEMAVQAALTGHLVLSTLHTNDAPSAITRLLEIGVAPYLINATLLGIVAQRLVKTLCPYCKKECQVDERQWRSLTQPWKVALPSGTYTLEGCLECRNTGYLGRVGLYEMLKMTHDMRNLVHDDTDLAALREQGCKENMQPLRISGARKISTGQTTMEEVLRVIPKLPDS